MANINGIEVSGTTYNLEDTTARNNASSAISTAAGASQTATEASQTATEASQTVAGVEQAVTDIQAVIPTSASSSNKLVSESEFNETVTVTLSLGYHIVVKKSGHTVFVSWALNGATSTSTLSSGNNTLATGLPIPVTTQAPGGSAPSVCLDMSGSTGQMNPSIKISVNTNGELVAYNGSSSSVSSVNVGAYLVYYTDD